MNYEHVLIDGYEGIFIGISYNLKQTVYWVLHSSGEIEVRKGILSPKLKKDIRDFVENKKEEFENGTYDITEEELERVVEFLTENDLKKHYYRGK